MENLASSPEKQALISSFLEIAVGQSAETAVQFLQATSWQLEEAIHLFYVGNEGAADSAASMPSPPPLEQSAREDRSGNGSGGAREVAEDEVRPPLPVVREVLYDDAAFYRMHKSTDDAFRDIVDMPKRSDVWESGQSTASTSNSSRDNLASLYRPPVALMYNGSFNKAKDEASLQGKWLLVNLQSAEEFASHMLNRDTWSNEAVVDTIKSNFIFWQAYHDATEGRKVCTYYKVVTLPAVLLIDPITGQKIHAWSGMVHPEQLLEDLLPYLDKGPRDHISLRHGPTESVPMLPNSFPVFQEDQDVGLAILASLEAAKAAKSAVSGEESKTEAVNTTEKLKYPPLPDEPKVERSLMCRVGIRLPDGRRLQRNFLRADPVQLLWSFCSSVTDEGETRPFHFSLAIPGAPKFIKYKSELTFEEAGLSNSIILLVWE